MYSVSRRPWQVRSCGRHDTFLLARVYAGLGGDTEYVQLIDTVTAVFEAPYKLLTYLLDPFYRATLLQSARAVFVRFSLGRGQSFDWL